MVKCRFDEGLVSTDLFSVWNWVLVGWNVQSTDGNEAVGIKHPQRLSPNHQAKGSYGDLEFH
jgi:hypothetical protein